MKYCVLSKFKKCRSLRKKLSLSNNLGTLGKILGLTVELIENPMVLHLLLTTTISLLKVLAPSKNLQQTTKMSLSSIIKRIMLKITSRLVK